MGTRAVGGPLTSERPETASPSIQGPPTSTRGPPGRVADQHGKFRVAGREFAEGVEAVVSVGVLALAWLALEVGHWWRLREDLVVYQLPVGDPSGPRRVQEHQELDQPDQQAPPVQVEDCRGAVSWRPAGNVTSLLPKQHG